MAFFKTKSKSTLIEFIITHFNEQQSWRKKEDSLEILVDLVRYVRPKNALKSKEVNLEDFIQFLNENTNYCQELSIYIKELLRDKKFNKILSDAAILQDFDFIFELKKRIYAKILPNQPKKNTLEYVLNQVFLFGK
jgi:site-specific recombinase